MDTDEHARISFFKVLCKVSSGLRGQGRLSICSSRVGKPANLLDTRRQARIRVLLVHRLDGLASVPFLEKSPVGCVPEVSVTPAKKWP